jgi:hypothetical protein
MNHGGDSWRSRLFKAGVAILLADVALYLYALVRVPNMTPLDVELRAGAWYFVIGSCIALVAALLILFGNGWKRLPLIIACLLILPLWYGFTLY